MDPLSDLLAVRWLPCKNEDVVDLAPFALAEPIDVREDGTILVQVPTVDSSKLLVVIGPGGAAADGYGECTQDWPAQVVYDHATGTPANAAQWGSAAGSQKLTYNQTGFLIMGGIDTTNHTVVVVQEVCRFD